MVKSHWEAYMCVSTFFSVKWSYNSWRYSCVNISNKIHALHLTIIRTHTRTHITTHIHTSYLIENTHHMTHTCTHLTPITFHTQAPLTHLHQLFQLKEHEMQVLKIAPEQVSVAVVEHDLDQHGKCLLLWYFLSQHKHAHQNATGQSKQIAHLIHPRNANYLLFLSISLSLSLSLSLWSPATKVRQP